MKHLLIGLGLTYLIHLSFNYYSLNSEIEDFSYAALKDNIAKYPNDKTFVSEVHHALSDNKIVGHEHKAIFERLLKINGVYFGAKMDSDHSNAKEELIKIMSET